MKLLLLLTLFQLQISARADVQKNTSSKPTSFKQRLDDAAKGKPTETDSSDKKATTSDSSTKKETWNAKECDPSKLNSFALKLCNASHPQPPEIAELADTKLKLEKALAEIAELKAKNNELEAKTTSDIDDQSEAKPADKKAPLTKAEKKAKLKAKKAELAAAKNAAKEKASAQNKVTPDNDPEVDVNSIKAKIAEKEKASAQNKVTPDNDPEVDVNSIKGKIAAKAKKEKTSTETKVNPEDDSDKNSEPPTKEETSSNNEIEINAKKAQVEAIDNQLAIIEAQLAEKIAEREAAKKAKTEDPIAEYNAEMAKILASETDTDEVKAAKAKQAISKLNNKIDDTKSDKDFEQATAKEDAEPVGQNIKQDPTENEAAKAKLINVKMKKANVEYETALAEIAASKVDSAEQKIVKKAEAKDKFENKLADILAGVDEKQNKSTEVNKAEEEASPLVSHPLTGNEPAQADVKNLIQQGEITPQNLNAQMCSDDEIDIIMDFMKDVVVESVCKRNGIQDANECDNAIFLNNAVLVRCDLVSITQYSEDGSVYYNLNLEYIDFDSVVTLNGEQIKENYRGTIGSTVNKEGGVDRVFDRWSENY